jgi:hypothetical protein
MSQVNWVRELRFPATTPPLTSPVVDRCAEIKVTADPGRAATAVLFCIRPRGHGGRHSATDGKYVIAVWS